MTYEVSQVAGEFAVVVRGGEVVKVVRLRELGNDWRDALAKLFAQMRDERPTEPCTVRLVGKWSLPNFRRTVQ